MNRPYHEPGEASPEPEKKPTLAERWESFSKSTRASIWVLLAIPPGMTIAALNVVDIPAAVRAYGATGAIILCALCGVRAFAEAMP